MSEGTWIPYLLFGRQIYYKRGRPLVAVLAWLAIFSRTSKQAALRYCFCCPPRSDFVYDLFEYMQFSEQGAGGAGGGGGGGGGGGAFRRGGKATGARKKTTVSTQFKVSEAVVM